MLKQPANCYLIILVVVQYFRPLTPISCSSGYIGNNIQDQKVRIRKLEWGKAWDRSSCKWWEVDSKDGRGFNSKHVVPESKVFTSQAEYSWLCICLEPVPTVEHSNLVCYLCVCPLQYFPYLESTYELAQSFPVFCHLIRPIGDVL